MKYKHVSTSWFKHITLNFVSHERMHAACNCNSNFTYNIYIHIWYHHVDRHEQWKRVAYLGLALAPKHLKYVPTNHRLPKRTGIDGQSLPGAPRHVRAKLRANIRRTDCVGPISIKSYLTPTIKIKLKGSNYCAEPCFCTLTAQKSKCSRLFLERPWNFAHVFNVPLSSPSRFLKIFFR